MDININKDIGFEWWNMHSNVSHIIVMFSETKIQFYTNLSAKSLFLPDSLAPFFFKHPFSWLIVNPP